MFGARNAEHDARALLAAARQAAGEPAHDQLEKRAG